MEIRSIEPKSVADIFSEKYKVAGQVLDYSVVIKLKFTYDGREHVIGIHRPYDRELSELGLSIMEATIERLLSGQQDAEKEIQLHYWYVMSVQEAAIAKGIVTGHPKLEDSISMHTSRISYIEIDAEREEAVITTNNNVYHCPLRYCRFGKQDEFPDMLPNYEALKEKYQGKIEYPEIDRGKVLLVLADFDDYYFHSLCVKDENGKPMEYTGSPHVGMFQDSYLIQTEVDHSKEDHDSIDIRYYPHYRNIEFYSCYTNQMPLYAENIGRSLLYIRLHGKTYSLAPRERKELTEKNACESVPDLPDGDLYPAGT